MALQEKKIMPPPWLAHREIERYSIGWRMGYGEDYIYRFGDWLDTLSPDERTEYRTLFPEPVTWKGWWDDEDSSEVLEHGDFWVNPVQQYETTETNQLPALLMEAVYLVEKESRSAVVN